MTPSEQRWLIEQDRYANEQAALTNLRPHKLVYPRYSYTTGMYYCSDGSSFLFESSAVNWERVLERKA